MVKIRSARILYSGDDRVLVSRGRHLWQSLDDGLTWSKVCSIPSALLYRLALKFSFVSRLLRLGCHHLVPIGENRVVIVFNRKIIWLDMDEGAIYHESDFVGSRPLSFCSDGKYIYYGEYRSNPERSPVSVWRTGVESPHWKTVLTLDFARHIHGVYYDSVSDRFWVTTGDENSESKVLLCDKEFNIYEIISEGGQQSRVVQPIFTDDFVCFASDAPEEQNYIYRYDRKLRETMRVAMVSGPIYFGAVVDHFILLSTVVEPSKVNDVTSIRLLASKDGFDWRYIAVFKKDVLPMKYFLYGQIFFGAIRGINQYIFFSENGTVRHLKLHRLSVGDIESLWSNSVRIEVH